MSTTSTPPGRVDPRGQRFAAAITSVVLVSVLLTESAWLLGVQAAIFAVGALAGVRRSPYSWLYARVIRPRLAPPTQWEAPQPPQFAQAVGLGFALIGIAGFLAGVPLVGLLATGMALVAAVLNAAFGLCLGCEMYLFVRRFARSRERRDNTTEVSV